MFGIRPNSEITVFGTALISMSQNSASFRYLGNSIYLHTNHISCCMAYQRCRTL